MYDQSYSSSALSTLMRRGDFYRVPILVRDMFRDATAYAAAESAITDFFGTNPIVKFHLKKKQAYRAHTIYNDLVIRKLGKNIQVLTGRAPDGRSHLATNLREFLREGVPYRVYRLDVRSFYESFSINELSHKVQVLHNLSPVSKRHLQLLLNHYQSLGGTGLPRGMAISAVLSDFMMSDFDSWMVNHPAVHFYGRYVDDIVVITNLTEDKRLFPSEIQSQLPCGLYLNKKKEMVKEDSSRAKVAEVRNQRITIDYLGYRFTVYDPLESDKVGLDVFRYVDVDISPVKVNRMKLRIVRALRDYSITKNADLLIDRFKFLTSNFSIVDRNTGKRQLAGIYYGYPLLTNNCNSLKSLDTFLRNSVLSKKGHVFSLTFPCLSPHLKRKLLSHSFQVGHKEQQFVHFSTSRIHEIQKCWKYK